MPNFDTLRKYMEANELAWEGPEEAIKSERVRQAIRASITHAANEHKVLAHVVAFGWRSDLVCVHSTRAEAELRSTTGHSLYRYALFGGAGPRNGVQQAQAAKYPKIL